MQQGNNLPYYNYGPNPTNSGLPSDAFPRPGIISQSTAEQIEIHRAISTFTTDNQIRRKMADDQIDQAKEQRDYDRRFKLLLLEDDLDQRKMAETVDFVRKSTGDLFAVYERPGTDSIEKTSVLTKIVAASNLKIISIICNNKGDLPDVVLVTWKLSDKDYSFGLSGKHINAEEFWRRLHKNGVDVLATVRSEKSVRLKLFAWLMGEHRFVQMPRTHGWVKNNEGRWEYISFAEETFMDFLSSGGGDLFD